jgi:DNA-binding CsgD family transcriptional regulator
MASARSEAVEIPQKRQFCSTYRYDAFASYLYKVGVVKLDRQAQTRRKGHEMPMEGQELEPVLERVTAPGFAIDTRGKVRWQNAAAIELLGDVRGVSFTVAVAPHDVTRLRRKFLHRITEGGSSDFEATLITGKGTFAPCGLSSTALHRDGAVVGLFGVITRGPAREHPAPVAPTRLTPRQYEVLQLLAGGAQTDEIAELLHLSRETVRNHIQGVLRRLEAKTRIEAVAIARREALLLQ